MLQRAITCDHCSKVQPLTDREYDYVLLDTIIPEGWVRLAVRNPRNYPWSDDTIEVSREADLCSANCASMFIYKLTINE